MGINLRWLRLQKRCLWLMVACVIVVVIAAWTGLDTRGIVVQGHGNLPWMPEVFAPYTTERKLPAPHSTFTIDTAIVAPKAPALTSDMGCLNLEHLDRERALVLGHRRKERGFLTIGITTVERINASYLHQTLSSLILNANATERSQIQIVVFACDFKESARQEARDIIFQFPEHVESGLLQLIEAPRSFYPPLKNLKRTYNNIDARVSWRSKENIDNVFLFAYSVNMSDYYLQLDDDFVTLPGYVSTIRNFIDLFRSEHWVLLDISEKGTGKLFRNRDLLHVARYLVQFYQEQPVDFLFSNLMQLHQQQHHFVLNPHIFLHLGNVSSLELKNEARRMLKSPH